MRCVTLSLALVVSVGCSPRVTGVVTSENDAVGTWNLALEECSSGQHEGFFGVDMWNKKDPSVRIRAIKDPVAGAVVFVRSSKTTDAGVRLTAADCEKLDLSVILSASTYNKIHGIDGALSMRCKKIAADLTFKACF